MQIKTCGDCEMLVDVNEEGEGYCALLDFFTFRNVDDAACEDNFIKKSEINRSKNVSVKDH
jgi:hypothetical protein